MIDNRELNKIVAALVAALLVIFGGREIATISLKDHGSDVAEAGYKLPVETASVQPGGKKKPAGLDFAQVVTLMQTASVDAGVSVFKKCGTCHTPTKGGKNGTGPNLWNIVDRDIGATEGFKYSGAMAEVEGNWSYEALAGFLHKPKKWLKGTKMAFGGLRREKDIADVLVYLRSLSDNPVALPTPVAATMPEPEAETPAPAAE